MRIKEEFKKSGYFWIPSTSERRVPGTLHISDGSAIELELIEPLDRFTDEPFELFNSMSNNSQHRSQKSPFYCDTLTFSISATTGFIDRSSISAIFCTA
jgi:ApeA N-terminal domain 1